MSKKLVKFKKKEDWDEYNVHGKGGIIGCLAKGQIFKKRIVLHPEWHSELTSECLRTIADKLDKLEAR